MRRWFWTGVVLFLAASLAGADGGGKKADPEPQSAYGTIQSLDIKDGVGTLTIVGARRKQDQPKVMKLEITRDTKFFKGGTFGPDASPGKRGDPVDAADAPEAFRNCRFLWILFTGEGDKMIATVVNVTT
jgi:hypothetical protein